MVFTLPFSLKYYLLFITMEEHSTTQQTDKIVKALSSTELFPTPICDLIAAKTYLKICQVSHVMGDRCDKNFDFPDNNSYQSLCELCAEYCINFT